MRMRTITSTFLLATGIVATGMLAPVTALAKVSLSLNTYANSNCVSGYKPADAPITVKLLKPNGSTRATRLDDTTSNEWQVCFDVVVMGSKVKLKTLDTDDSVLARTVKIPVLTVFANRVSNVVGGQTPSGGVVTIVYSKCTPGSCSALPPRHATANSHGRYQKDLSSAPTSADIDGGDLVEVRYQNGLGDTFKASTFASFMEIQVPNKIYVACQPRGTTTLQLHTSSGKLRASKSFHETEDCSGDFGAFRNNGNPVNVHVGDRVTGDFASDAALTWPSMDVTGAVHQLSGHCLKNSNYAVFLYHSFGTSYEGVTDGNGDFSVDLTGFWTFQPGDTLDLACETIRGDRVRTFRML